MTQTSDTLHSDAPAEADAAPSGMDEIVDTVRTVAVALAAAVLFQTMAFQPFTIPSASMEPGLVVGDYLVVSKFSYGWSRASLPFNPPLPPGRLFGHLPKRGDVVVFRRPRTLRKPGSSASSACPATRSRSPMAW